VKLHEQPQAGRSPGNVVLSPRITGLGRESVANVSQIVGWRLALGILYAIFVRNGYLKLELVS
jgi:hypothetical protein